MLKFLCPNFLRFCLNFRQIKLFGTCLHSCTPNSYTTPLLAILDFCRGDAEWSAKVLCLPTSNSNLADSRSSPNIAVWTLLPRMQRRKFDFVLKPGLVGYLHCTNSIFQLVPPRGYFFLVHQVTPFQCGRTS